MLFCENSFMGKRILVTGASSGIGRELAVQLSKLGASMVLVSRNEQRLNQTLSMLSAISDDMQHQAIAFDLCDIENYKTLFSQMFSNNGSKLDGLVHCAGVGRIIPIKTLSISSFQEIMTTNFSSFIFLMKEFYKKPISNDCASVVACSSVSVHYAQKCMSVYAASKAALEGSVRSLATEFYDARKIRINTMVIGPIPAVLPAPDSDGSSPEFLNANLMGFGTKQDISNMAIFLLSDASKYATGREFYVDGGWI